MARAIPLTAIITAIVINILWGGNAVAVKFSLQVFPPLWSAFFRFIIGALCILAWARWQGIKIAPQAGEWRGLWPVTALFFVQIYAMNAGIERISGSAAAVLTSTFPLFAAVFAHFMLQSDKLSWRKSVGLGAAFGGTAMIVARGGNNGDAVAFLGVGAGDLLVLVSSVLLGLRLIYSARLMGHINATRLILWMMILSLPAFGLGAVTLETVQWQNITWPPVLGLLYQGVVIAGLGFMVNALLIKRYSPSMMISFGFISPLSGVLLSLWLLSDNVSWALASGALAVGLGLFIIARAEAAKTAALHPGQPTENKPNDTGANNTGSKDTGANNGGARRNKERGK